jgi:hypothetical protein
VTGRQFVRTSSWTIEAADTLAGMGRIGRGWALTKQSWSVVRDDRSLLLFPVVAAVSAIVVGAVFFGVGAGVGAASDSFWAAAPFLVVGVYALIVVGQFAAVALAACATAALDGRDTTFGEGVAAARSRLTVILQWSLVQLVVGSLISAIQAALREGVGGLISSIVGGILNASWSVATFFVVPVIALDGLGPREAFTRSAGIVRERWGEGVVGSATIGGAIFLAGILPGAIVVFLGVLLAAGAPAAGAVVIALGAIVIVFAVLLQATLSAVFRVALYRFATVGDAPGSFSQAQLAGAFVPKKRGRRGLFGR